jgi:hypothetical protein
MGEQQKEERCAVRLRGNKELSEILVSRLDR